MNKLTTLRTVFLSLSLFLSSVCSAAVVIRSPPPPSIVSHPDYFFSKSASKSESIDEFYLTGSYVFFEPNLLNMQRYYLSCSWLYQNQGSQNKEKEINFFPNSSEAEQNSKLNFQVKEGPQNVILMCYNMQRNLVTLKVKLTGMGGEGIEFLKKEKAKREAVK